MIPLREIKPGHWLGKYQVVDTLGRHRGHWCYAARPLVPRREGRVPGSGADALVLLKCPDEGGRDLELLKLRFDEAQLGALVRHPNVARLYESGHDRDHCQLVMELVRGEPLARLLPSRPLSTAATLAVGRQLAAALHYAHELCTAAGPLHIVHRNLSPESVIIAADGFVKLVDFEYMWPGAAGFFLSDRSAEPERFYLSPEQCRGKPLDRRSDVFNAGIVLYEASTGRYPFSAASPFEVMENISAARFPPPSAWIEDYPAELEHLVMTALQRDPASRQQTAQELRVDLELVAEELGFDCTGNPRLPLAAHLASLD